jgi:hypothetical protein
MAAMKTHSGRADPGSAGRGQPTGGRGWWKLFTSLNVLDHPVQQLLQRAAWRRVGLLHGLDEKHPELFSLCRGIRLRDSTGARS